jgi:hypothetical protein
MIDMRTGLMAWVQSTNVKQDQCMYEHNSAQADEIIMYFKSVLQQTLESIEESCGLLGSNVR